MNFQFLAPTGAQEVTLCVRLSVRLFVRHKVLIRPLNLHLSSSGLQAVSQQAVSQSAVSLQLGSHHTVGALNTSSCYFKHVSFLN